MKLKVNKTGFDVEADLGAVEDIALKQLPQIIKNWWKTRKNKKLVEKAIHNIRSLAFKPWKKHWPKFHIYQNFSLPENMEQVKAQAAFYLKHIGEPEHFKDFESQLDKELAHHEFIKKFQEENGGQNNFGVYLEKGLKINGFTMFPFRKVYTYSRKGKAVCVLEEFRPSDNSYNIFVYCTKNWEHNKQ